jgi:hypothetical protein
MYAYGGTTGMIQLRHVADMLSARAEQLSKSGRKEEFIVLAKQRDAVIAHIGRNPDTNLIGELVYAVIAKPSHDTHGRQTGSVPPADFRSRFHSDAYGRA